MLFLYYSIILKGAKRHEYYEKRTNQARPTPELQSTDCVMATWKNEDGTLIFHPEQAGVVRFIFER